MAPGPTRVVVAGMAREERSEMREIVRRHLDNKGYVVRLTSHREGDNLVGRVHVTDASTEETVAKVVGVGKVNNIEIVFGIDATDGTFRGLIAHAPNLAEGARV